VGSRFRRIIFLGLRLEFVRGDRRHLEIKVIKTRLPIRCICVCPSQLGTDVIGKGDADCILLVVVEVGVEIPRLAPPVSDLLAGICESIDAPLDQTGALL